MAPSVFCFLNFSGEDAQMEISTLGVKLFIHNRVPGMICQSPAFLKASSSICMTSCGGGIHLSLSDMPSQSK